MPYNSANLLLYFLDLTDSDSLQTKIMYCIWPYSSFSNDGITMSKTKIQLFAAE
jgi:hypothetical protein